MKKTKTISIVSEFSNAIRHAKELDKVSSGEIYRIQPVSLDDFVMSPEYLNQGVLGGMSANQREFIEAGSDLDNNLNFFVLWVGKGAGKNWASAILFLRVIYKLLCMYDPHGFLKHNPVKDITLMNVAINAPQARDNFFEPLSNILKAAGPRAFREFGFDPALDIYINQVKFPRNIEILSGNSRSGSMEGYDVLMGLMDEVDDTDFHGAEKLLTTLRSSAQSRFRGREKILAISYSRYEGSSGRISELYENSKGVSHIFARRYASWEFHPTLTKEDFATAFGENPEKASCIYGSEIKGSFIDSWIKDARRLKNAFNWDRKWIFDWKLPYDSHEVGSSDWITKISHNDYKLNPLSEHIWYDDQGEQHSLDPYDIPISVYGDPNQKYVFVGDPGLGSELNGGDAYGVALAHAESVVSEDGKKLIRPVIDFVFRFTGRMFNEGQVQIAAVEQLIRKLNDRRGFNIKVYSFDAWNSAQLSQWVSRTYKSIVVMDGPREVVTIVEYTSLRDAIFGEAPPSDGSGKKEENGGIDMPWHPVLYTELKELREDRVKNKVDHTSSSSKDMADCLAKAVHIIIHRWPYVEFIASGTTTGSVIDQYRAKLLNKVATEEERKEFQEKLNSEIVGLGAIKTKTKSLYTVEDILR